MFETGLRGIRQLSVMVTDWNKKAKVNEFTAFAKYIARQLKDIYTYIYRRVTVGTLSINWASILFPRELLIQILYTSYFTGVRLAFSLNINATQTWHQT